MLHQLLQLVRSQSIQVLQLCHARLRHITLLPLGLRLRTGTHQRWRPNSSLDSTLAPLSHRLPALSTDPRRLQTPMHRQFNSNQRPPVRMLHRLMLLLPTLLRLDRYQLLSRPQQDLRWEDLRWVDLAPHPVPCLLRHLPDRLHHLRRQPNIPLETDRIFQLTLSRWWIF